MFKFKGGDVVRVSGLIAVVREAEEGCDLGSSSPVSCPHYLVVFAGGREEWVGEEVVEG